MKKHLQPDTIADMIRHAGEKATPARIDIIQTLMAEQYPLSIKELEKKVKGPNQSTLYRSLTSLVDAKLVRESHLGTDAVRYEMAVGRHHHHHIVCTSCGDIEDVETCAIADATTSVKTKKFDSITDHSLEFFGICKSCARS